MTERELALLVGAVAACMAHVECPRDQTAIVTDDHIERARLLVIINEEKFDDLTKGTDANG